ncbi:hypothetical protein ACFPZ0_12085 [Streptomonospora nanhaiensis]|uniref:DUF485 domain-containing protein n=1 Tax=Streptomonospora nanhaiensis TaxID=1323731 RepID=A0A853BT95_9ACTN|nr:hypothetical protein [Streptomonospora nanhaiensis]MBV2365396.1 hypothetical protein [Streptomonospora nanhaiensis]MBX9390712.1 hypothetical protein [Streptomonospora nanhaiensis]NYI99009.1 hypothetical protein [Streptomonospora nanhaiensis]
MPQRPRRVAVTSPQTRLAHARGRARGRWRVPRLDPADADRALRLYRRQRAQALRALAAVLVLLIGLPAAFALWPEGAGPRLLGVPLAWPLLAWLPYPAMMLLARWQLRRAEHIEEG